MAGETKGSAPKVVEAEALVPKSKSMGDHKPDESRKGLLAKSALTRRVTYKPSHKATFVGAAVVIVILLINAGVVWYFINAQNSQNASNDSVTIGPVDLETLGVSRNTIGNEGTKLVVGPDATFNGTLTVADAVSIGGDLQLNSELSASTASFERLQAGNTSLSELTVNGDITATSLNLRQNLAAVGSATFQGTVTMQQLLTVNNNVSVAGNLAIGGTLSVGTIRAVALQSDSTLTIGGHILTQGAAPSIGPGNALGSNGTVSISGNDASGTIAINVGVGAGSGTLASVGFRTSYSSTPHVVFSPAGRSASSVYINRTPSGFTLNTSAGLPAGGYIFDYIVMH